MPAAVKMSRKTMFSQPPLVLDAALRIPEKQLPGWTLVDLGNDGIAVLKAGLTKLLQNGKNRIIVHLFDCESLSSDVIRELAILDVFARELSGKIVLVSNVPTL